MAFQTGSRIRPELANADYSGFTNAANIRANAMANFGAQIGQGIEKYRKNKEITGVTLASIEATLGQNPDLIVSGKAEGGSTGKLFSKLEEGGSLNKREALELRGYLDTVVDARNAASQREMEAAKLDFLRGTVTKQGQEIDQANVMNPIITEQALANVAATEQGTAASQAGVAMAERKQVLSEKLAKQTQEQNERDYNLKVEELRLKVRAAAQRDPVSAKKLEAAQTYLDDNDLIMVDGAVYSKGGWFSGKATEVMNPAVMNIEGMEDLRRISMDMQSVPSNAASGNFEGYSIQSEGAGGQPVASDAAVSAAALDSVVQPRPEGSRISRAMSAIGDAYGTTDAVINQMGESMIARPFAIYDYFTKPNSPTYDESLRRREAQVRNSGLRSQPFRDR